VEEEDKEESCIRRKRSEWRKKIWRGIEKRMKISECRKKIWRRN
jgi:hypothetical protein